MLAASSRKLLIFDTANKAVYVFRLQLKYLTIIGPNCGELAIFGRLFGFSDPSFTEEL